MGGRIRQKELDVAARPLESNGKNGGRPRSFEGWLEIDRLPGPAPAKDSPMRARALYDNLAHVCDAPYTAQTKARVLTEHYNSHWPQKALGVLKALHDLAVQDPAAANAFQEVAVRWLGDDSLSYVYKRIWSQGVRFIRNAAKELHLPELKQRADEAKRLNAST